MSLKEWAGIEVKAAPKAGSIIESSEQVGQLVAPTPQDVTANPLNAEMFSVGYGGPSPWNRPAFNSLRLADYPSGPRMFTTEQGEEIAAYRAQVQEWGGATIKAYSDLEDIARVEGDVHVAHNGLVKTLAKVEYQKVKSNIDVGKTLSALAGQYTQAYAGLNKQIEFDRWQTGQRVQELNTSFARRRNQLVEAAQRRQALAGQKGKKNAGAVVYPSAFQRGA